MSRLAESAPRPPSPVLRPRRRRVWAIALVAVVGAVAVFLAVKPETDSDSSQPRRLIGTNGADDLSGGESADLIVGRGGADSLSGGAGADRIVADERDRVDAGPGDDRVELSAAAGSLDVRCGSGSDRLTIAATAAISFPTVQRQASSCERVVVSRGPGVPVAPGGPEIPALPAASSAEPVSLPKPSVFVAPDGSDRASCSAGAPCRSLNRAYQVAEQGDVVQLQDGTYPEQILEYDKTKTSQDDVSFVPAPGASPRVGFVRFGEWTADLGARHVTFKDLTLEGFMTQRTEDLTFDDVTIDGGFWIQGAQDVTVRGGAVGGTQGLHSDIVEWQHPCCGVVPPERILIDGVRFHDMVMKAPGDHIECLQVTGGRDITIRNSRFHRCDHMDINAGDGATRLDGMLIENNFLETSTARFGPSYYSLSVRTGKNVIVRHNSSSQAWIGPDPGVSAEGWLVANNLMPGAGDERCHESIAYSHNLWTDGTRCAPTDRGGKAGFLDAEAGDFRLGEGSPALDAADPQYAPAADLAGRARPSGRAPDVGASER